MVDERSIYQLVTTNCNPPLSMHWPPPLLLETWKLTSYLHIDTVFPPPPEAALPSPWSSPQRGAVIRKCKFSPKFHFIYQAPCHSYSGNLACHFYVARLTPGTCTLGC